MCEPLRGKKKFLKEMDCIQLEGNFELGYDTGVDDSFKCFKSAVEFYKKFDKHYHIFMNCHDKGHDKHIAHFVNYLETKEGVENEVSVYVMIKHFNDWLFDYCFGDCIDD